MQNLTQYINKINTIRTLFNEKNIDLNSLSDSDISAIKSNLESDLSPENLFADGEISRQQAQQKELFFKNVLKDLEEKTQKQIQLYY
tara:strand:+ start:5247 stop:5507 length:261 start_codon:yes stop_codon:yes gene_type:complete